MRHGTCFHRRLSARRAGAAPHSAVAELGVVRRSPGAVPRITPAMANFEANVTSRLSGYVSGALRSLDLLGFAHAGTLAAMRGVPPVPASFARRLRTQSVRVQACSPDGFPPTPKPPLVSQPQTGQHGPLLAAARSAASIFTHRPALTRRGWRESQRTPNHALQRTAALAFSYRCAALTPTGSVTACAPAMKPGTCRAFASRRSAHTRASGLRSLSLGSLGVTPRLL